MTELTDDPCKAPLHPQAAEGLRLFNAGGYFEAHEALEDAWNAESGKVRSLYQGILQIAVVYLHITRGNYNGAIKVYRRGQPKLKDWANICRGVYVDELRKNAETVMNGQQAGAHLHRAPRPEGYRPRSEKHIYLCDRCGSEMHEKNCKVTCPNCGNRFDCSDLNIYFD